MDKINSLKAREILDSRGNPTVEVTLETGRGFFVSSVPSGASTGSYEAIELRDGGDRYHGKGVLNAVANINEVIAPVLKGKKVTDQKLIDDLMIEMDATNNKSRLGANSILGVSMALCRAGSSSSGVSLYNYISDLSGEKVAIPEPSFNVINGGAHAGNELDFQEFMILPEGDNFKERLRKSSERYHDLKKKIEVKYSQKATNVGDEGGFAPPIIDPEEALDLILGSGKINIALDVAAGEFLKKDKYVARFRSFSGKELGDYYIELIKKYPIISLEDPFGEDDWENWKDLTSRVPSGLLIVGDDLLATNPERIRKAGKEKACNAMILKLNQIGTVSEGIGAAGIAREFGWKIMVSHRSGETTDDFISDFAVGIGSDYIKSGAPARGERVVKYNRLLVIEEDLEK